MWGTTGIGYNVKAVYERLGPNAKIDSWDVVFKPELISKFKDCGVVMLDSVDDIVPAALHYLGSIRIRPNRSTSSTPQRCSRHSSEYINALASGEVCLVIGWSGDIKQTQKRAQEAKNGIDIDYSFRKRQMWFDNVAIPKDAPHPKEAYAFIEYLLRPEVAAKNSNFIACASANLTSE